MKRLLFILLVVMSCEEPASNSGDQGLCMTFETLSYGDIYICNSSLTSSECYLNDHSNTWVDNSSCEEICSSLLDKTNTFQCIDASSLDVYNPDFNTIMQTDEYGNYLGQLGTGTYSDCYSTNFTNLSLTSSNSYTEHLPMDYEINCDSLTTYDFIDNIEVFESVCDSLDIENSTVIITVEDKAHLVSTDVGTELIVAGADGFEIIDVVVVNSNESITNEEIILPTEASIGIPYPNPFNQTTSFDYTLPQAMSIKIDLVNKNNVILHTFLNEIQDTGQYSISVNFSNIYFNGSPLDSDYYRIVADFGDYWCYVNVLYSN